MCLHLAKPASKVNSSKDLSCRRSLESASPSWSFSPRRAPPHPSRLAVEGERIFHCFFLHRTPSTRRESLLSLCNLESMRLDDDMDASQAGGAAGANSSSDFVSCSPVLSPWNESLILTSHICRCASCISARRNSFPILPPKICTVKADKVHQGCWRTHHTHKSCGGVMTEQALSSSRYARIDGAETWKSTAEKYRCRMRNSQRPSCPNTSSTATLRVLSGSSTNMTSTKFGTTTKKTLILHTVPA